MAAGMVLGLDDFLPQDPKKFILFFETFLASTDCSFKYSDVAICLNKTSELYGSKSSMRWRSASSAGVKTVGVVLSLDVLICLMRYMYRSRLRKHANIDSI